MSRQSDNSDGWTWRQPVGQLRCGPLAGRVDVARPQLGLHQLQLGGAALGGQLLGVAWDDMFGQPSAEVADSYVRATDLVAAYQPRADWPYAPQVYWRAESPAPAGAALAALVLWVSVQTDRLDTHPTAGVESRLPADELLCLTMTDGADAAVQSLAEPGQWQTAAAVDSSCLLWRLPGGQFSCAQFARTGDARELRTRTQPDSIAKGGEIGCRWELFADFLEKGVIRRACLQTVLVPRADDVDRAAACWRQFQARPLPLTA